MSASGIRLNYQQSKQEVKELKSIANGLEHVSRDLSKTMKKLSGCWESQSAIEYMEKGMFLVNRIERTSTKMRDLADRMSDIAEALMNADQANKGRIRII